MEALSADKQQVLSWEQRWGKPVGLASIAAVLVYIGSGLLVSLGHLVDSDDKATELQSFHDHATGLLGSAALSAVGSLLLIPALYFLFRAAQARNPDVKAGLLPFMFIGPVLLAAQSLLAWGANNSVANDFVDQVGTRTGEPAADLAQKMLDDSSFVQVAGGIAIPAVLGIIIAMMYVSLMAMRTGLVTRFWGTFGMAFSVGVLILGLIGVMIFILYIGLLAAGWINRPPAWDAVEPIPWPTGGMRPDGPGSLDPSAVETGGREIDVGESPDAGNEEPPPVPDSPGEAGGEPRKRKRRA